MRSVLVKAAVLAVATAVTSVALVGCSTKDDTTRPEDVGSVGLDLDIGGGVIVETVSYTITGNGITPINGTIPVADAGATVSVLIGGLPAGTGYTIALSATSVDGVTHCAGSAPFSVVAGQTVAVSVDLVCDAPDNDGQITVNGRVDNCPRLTFYSVAPLTVNVGGHIAVNATATDIDGNPLTFAWTASPAAGGTFAAPGTANTVFTCMQGSPATGTVLNLSVTDGLCSDTAAITVTCRQVGCGNGTLDPGETCDDSNTVNGDACPDDCTLPVCGDSKVETATGSTPVEQCDDGNTNPLDNCDACRLPVCGDGRRNGSEQCDGGPACNAQCQNIVCGDGRVDGPTETCDPPGTPLPGGQICGPTCTAGAAPPVCGNGIVQPPTEQCEGPASPGNVAQPSGSSQGCGATCQNLLSAACVNCEAASADCADYAPGCEAPHLNTPAVEGPAAGTSRKALCYETAECVRRTGCANSATGGTNCYCGTADAVTCLGGGAAVNGACKAEIERSMESTSASTIAALRFGDPTYGGGFWMGRLNCDRVIGCPCVP